MVEMPSFYPVTCHTDYVGPGSTFVAIPGCNHDGVSFIVQAIAKGATTIVAEEGAVISSKVNTLIKNKNIRLLRVENTRKALAQLSAQVAGYPADKLKIVGITGTKGKTTTAFILRHVLQEAGYNVALLSTVKNSINNYDFSSPLTTAQPDYLHQFFKLCVSQNIDFVVMEVAAQALSLHRVESIQFDAIVFTNFALEHLEFYRDMNHYFTAKCLLFNQRKPNAPAFINADDEWVCQLTKKFNHCFTFGCGEKADVTGELQKGLPFQCSLFINQAVHTIVCPTLLGKCSVYNILATVSIAWSYGISLDVIISALKSFSGTPGRFEQHQLANGATCIIDYAHNPSSFHALLPELRMLTDNLIVLFGAGGDRDASKRPIMGNIASKYADHVVLTSDNPRSEDPYKIIQDIQHGINQCNSYKVTCESNRKKAIKKAYTLSKKGSIIALLGKGPDEYQIINGKKSVLSEREIIQYCSKIKE